jgi:hypothetical protein
LFAVASAAFFIGESFFFISSQLMVAPYGTTKPLITSPTLITGLAISVAAFTIPFPTAVAPVAMPPPTVPAALAMPLPALENAFPIFLKNRF